VADESNPVSTAAASFADFKAFVQTLAIKAEKAEERLEKIEELLLSGETGGLPVRIFHLEKNLAEIGRSLKQVRLYYENQQRQLSALEAVAIEFRNFGSLLATTNDKVTQLVTALKMVEKQAEKIADLEKNVQDLAKIAVKIDALHIIDNYCETERNAEAFKNFQSYGLGIIATVITACIISIIAGGLIIWRDVETHKPRESSALIIESAANWR